MDSRLPQNSEEELAYKHALTRYFTHEVPTILVVGTLVITACMYALDRFSPGGIQNWGWTTAILIVCVSMPPLTLVKPKRPLPLMGIREPEDTGE